MQDALDTTHEITKLIKKSPARDAIFKRLKEEIGSDSPGIRVLCPTRWTVRAEALKSILDNFNVLLELWAESLERVKDTEMKARIQGVSAQMMRFDYFFGVSLGLLILRHTDNLSKTMQKADILAAEGQAIAVMTVSTLKSLRNDANFVLFWQRSLLLRKIFMLTSLPYLAVARFPVASTMVPHLPFTRRLRTTTESYILRRSTSSLHASRIVLTSPVTRPMQMSKRSSSRLQLQSHMKKNCDLFSPFMVQILIPYSFQRIWKYSQKPFELTKEK